MSKSGFWKCPNNICDTVMFKRQSKLFFAYIYIRSKAIRQKNGAYLFKESVDKMCNDLKITRRYLYKILSSQLSIHLGPTEYTAQYSNIFIQFSENTNVLEVEKMPSSQAVHTSVDTSVYSEEPVLIYKNNNKNKSSSNSYNNATTIPNGIESISGDFLKSWNGFAKKHGLALVQKITASRKSKLKTRIDEGLSIEKFEEILKKLEKLKFYLGDNDRGWKVDFDYLVRNDTNWVKLSERFVKPEEDREALFEGMSDEDREYFEKQGW